MTFPSPNQDIGNGASFLTRFIERNPTILRSDRLIITNGPLQHYGVEQSILRIVEHQPIFVVVNGGGEDRNGIFVVTRSMKVTESHTKKEAQVVALFLGLKWGDWFQCLLAGN